MKHSGRALISIMSGNKRVNYGNVTNFSEMHICGEVTHTGHG